MSRVLLISHATIGERMAAPGIRYAELGRVLAPYHEVTVAAPLGSDERSLDGLRLYDPRRPASLRSAIAAADVVISQPLPPRLVSRAGARGGAWLVDLLNPEPFEGLEHHRHRSPRARRALEMVRIDRLTFALSRGSAFMCASERQRDMWLGFLAACRRLERRDSRADRELRDLIDVVPSGVPVGAASPPPTPVLRGVALRADARILVWNGGVWDWLDAPMIVRALAHLREHDPRWVLVFQGGLAMPKGTRASNAASSSAIMDLMGRYRLGPDAVLLHDAWTPYERRGDMLVEADVGVCAHPRTMEARFAFRNRLLDFVWARLPVVCTAGDPLAEDVASHNWGEVVPPGDSVAFAAAAARVCERGRGPYRTALEGAARRFAWSEVARPLLRLIGEVTGRPLPRRPGARSRGAGARHTAADLAARAAKRP